MSRLLTLPCCQVFNGLAAWVEPRVHATAVCPVTAHRRLFE